MKKATGNTQDFVVNFLQQLFKSSQGIRWNGHYMVCIERIMHHLFTSLREHQFDKYHSDLKEISGGPGQFLSLLHQRFVVTLNLQMCRQDD